MNASIKDSNQIVRLAGYFSVRLIYSSILSICKSAFCAVLGLA